MGCATSKRSATFHFIDEDGESIDFWIKHGKLHYALGLKASVGAALEIKDVVQFKWLGDSPDGYLYDGSGRIGPMKEVQFCKLQSLASQTGLHVESAQRVKALHAKLLHAGDQLVFRPCSAVWAVGDYHHFCRPETVVEFSKQDASDARGCHVLFPRGRVKQWTLWEDLQFFIHVGSRRAIDIEAQDTISRLVDDVGNVIPVDAADFADDMTGFRAAVAKNLGHSHPLAWVACYFVDINGKACEDMQSIFVASGKGDVTSLLDQQMIANLKVPTRVVQLNGQEVSFSLGEYDVHIRDLRVALARPLGHTPLAAPGFQLIDAQGKTLEDIQYICEASALGTITVVLNEQVISELESPSNLAIAIASKAAEGEDWGTFHSGMYAGQRQQVKLLYNYCRPEGTSKGSICRERYDFHVYSLEEKQFVEHGHVGAD